MRGQISSSSLVLVDVYYVRHSRIFGYGNPSAQRKDLRGVHRPTSFESRARLSHAICARFVLAYESLRCISEKHRYDRASFVSLILRLCYSLLRRIDRSLFRATVNHQVSSSQRWQETYRPSGPFTMVVKHLPPVVKQLLTLRNPGLPPAPPVSKLSAVLTSTFKDAQERRAEKGWLTLTVRTILLDEPTHEASKLKTE